MKMMIYSALSIAILPPGCCKLIMGFNSCLLLDMWPKCDWDSVMLLGMQWFLGYVKFEQGQKVLQYLDYGNHIIFLVVMSMCSWHIRCTNASRIMWCIKRLSGMRHGEHHSCCKGIIDVCNVSFRFFFQVAQITLWLGNRDIPLPFSLHSTTIW
jgi:hypothetical protein